MKARQTCSLSLHGALRLSSDEVMLRNIPNRYTCEELLSEVIMAGFDRMSADLQGLKFNVKFLHKHIASA